MGDLRWKLEYEQGLHAEMVELLEKKVAGNLVRIHTFEEAEEELIRSIQWRHFDKEMTSARKEGLRTPNQRGEIKVKERELKWSPEIVSNKFSC